MAKKPSPLATMLSAATVEPQPPAGVPFKAGVATPPPKKAPPPKSKPGGGKKAFPFRKK
jgi:hypothetical protein